MVAQLLWRYFGASFELPDFCSPYFAEYTNKLVHTQRTSFDDI